MRINALITLTILLLTTRYTHSQNHPEFAQNEYTQDIFEDADIGDVVLTVVATDVDSHGITFSIEGESHSLFTLNSDTGVITVNNELDRESQDLIQFDVIAVDDGPSPQTSTTQVIIAILDVNDNKPEFITFPNPVILSEDAAVSNVTPIATYVATDADAGTNGQVRYTLEGNAGSRFSVNLVKGRLFFERGTLDFEVQETFSLLIIATDKGTPALSRQKAITITVTNVDDSPPEFQNLPYTVSTPEDTVVTTDIFSAILAVDQDSEFANTIIYDIQSGDPLEQFAITGNVLSVADLLDFETTTKYELVILAKENTTVNPTQQTATATVTVVITDVNDVAPVLPNTVLATVSESIEITHSVVQLEFTDVDTVESSYVFTILTAGAKFAVSNTGLITIASTLDFETLTPETFDVQMCEATNLTLCDTTTVQVTVTDENDNSPFFAATEYRATIKEEQMNPNFLTVTADDNDISSVFGSIVYSIEGVESASFSVIAATGLISNIAGLDREANPVIDLIYVATDTDPAHPRRTSVPLVITLEDINDQIPAFLSIPTPFAFDVPEGSAQDIFTFSVSDGDLADNAATSVSVDNAEFRVDPATGTEFTLKTSGALDRETIPSYTLVITVTDSGTPPLSDNVTCTVTVTDINDETPVFGALQSVTFPENTAITTAIDTITATDADIDANARLTYEIESGDVDGVFEIDSATGAISLQNSLDYETTQLYQLEIIALDAADPPLTGTGSVQVTITDINDNTPTFVAIRYEFTVTELADLDTLVGSVAATDGDLDSPNNAFTFSITSGNTLSTFKLSVINPGEILIDTPPLFNVTPSFTLTITVTDGGTPALLSTVSVVVTVIDTNNNAPVLTGPYSFTVTEGTHADTPVGIITATDVDSNAVTEFIFSLLLTTTFQIDPATGVISTIGADIDRETTPTYTFTAQVDDSSTSSNQDTETVTVTVIDVNDNNPVFTGTPYTVTAVPENSEANEAVFTVSASDADDGVNADITFVIIGGNQLGYFKIDSVTGAITTTGTTIDFEEIETVGSVTITVEARDAGAVQRATDLQVVIPIQDLNDNTPSFLGTPYSTSVAEEITIGTTVFTIIKQDADTTLDVTLTIIAGDPGSAFRTDGMDVILLNLLDRETTPSYTLTLELDDTATTITTPLDITLIDFNDNPPVLGSNTVTFIFAEDRAPGLITTILASDIDEGVNSRLRYDIDDTHGVFELGQTTGVLTQVSFFDVETVSSYTLTITVTDGGLVAMSVVETITITITDVNEFIPTFESELFREGILEDQTVPYDFVSNTLAVDGDFELATNGKIIHSIVGVEPVAFLGDFSINEDTGQLTLANMLDYEAIQEAVITIMALDQATSGAALSSTARVIFTVTDVNDNSPIFVSNIHTLSIFENAASPATIGVFTATDLDSGLFSEITYSNSANMPTQFTYDATTGVLTQTATFDRENLPHTNPVTFQVIATDGVNQDTADVTLTILDQNDNAPVYDQPSYAMSIPENFIMNDVVITVTATETNTDDGNSAIVQYTITHGGSGHFAIDATSGEITSLLTFNREVEDTFELTVAAFDQSVNPLSTFVAVTITITDVNDNPPVFTFSTYQVTVSEGGPPQSVISDVDIFATDADLSTNVDITYDIADATFSASTTAGKLAQIVSVMDIDFETTPSFTVEITAKDAASGGMTGTATLIITVIDTNDNPPVFNTSVTAFSFSESTSGGTVLFTISATDADSTTNADITYSVTSGDDGRFAVQPDTGIVTTTSSPFDFESTTSYTVGFTAVDGGSPPNSDTISITVTITDVNDNPPVYSSDPFTFEVDENDPSLTFDISATDSDSSTAFNQITYEITAETEHDLFVIDSATGIVSLLQEFDRESGGLEILSTGLGLHELVVQATDPDNPAFTATTHVLISVRDLNDNNPFIDRECPISLTVQEEVTAHEEILTSIPTSDADFAQTLVYIIVSGNEGREFRINNTGDLEVFGTLLNREFKPSFDLLLEVRDGGTPELTSTCHILVTVDDSNDFPPVFPDNPNMTIPENTDIGTELLTYIASDEDIGINADIVYTINSGNIGTKFELGQDNGVLKVVGEFDFETLPIYTLEILATDKGTPPMTGTGTITIIITDVNDNPPVFTSATAINFAENIANNTQVYDAMATDADSGVNKNITYTIQGTDFGIFTLDPTTGILSIMNNTNIDRETIDEYQLIIVATDGGTPALTDSLTLIITIDDINDNIPVFPYNGLTLDIVEDTAAEEYIGQILLTLSGSDMDIGVNGDFEFRIDAGDDASLFTLTTAGVLTRSASIDREVYDSITLTLTIYDLATNPLSSSISLNINITDSNDNTPVFGNTTYTYDVNENSIVTFLIGVITASDEDEGVNQDISFKIPDTSQPFAIDATSGELTVKVKLDRETTDRYEFELEGYDTGVHPRTGTTTVIINVLDFNDNQPSFPNKVYPFEIPEHFMLDTTFGKVEATDADLAPNNVLYYYIESGNETFAIAHETGEISLVRDLDRENSSDVRVTGTVIVSNSMTYPSAPFDFEFSRTEISTTISDINDNPPIFTMAWYRGGVLSDTEFDSVVLSVIASDLDISNDTYFGGEVRFVSIPETSASEFRVDLPGNIHLAADVTDEVGNFFDLRIIGSDNRMMDLHHNQTTRATLWVITIDQQIKITFEISKTEVLEMKYNIIEILENITGSLINIDLIVYNPINNEHTDVYFHAVDASTLAIVARTSVIRVVDENRDSVGTLFKDFVVTRVEPASSPVVTLDPFLLGLSVVLAILVLICCCLLILCVIYDQVRRKQIKHRQRVSLLKSYDASLDYNYSLSGQTYENPMWLHPYEQWEKEDDQFTKGNPLFYESQEFVMDMFRESDEEKSEETISFGSWGASKTKIRGGMGRTARSGTSTITRMSDVDQDYNVDLLAEVLGDDLPPSGAEPSEISNI